MDLDKVKKRLIQEESMQLFPYKCSANKLTLGVGRNIEDRGISDVTAMQMLEEDIDLCVEELARNITWWEEAPDGIQEVLIDLCFNMGISRLMLFTKTLGYMGSGEMSKAADELLNSRYATMVPNRAKRNADIIRSYAS